MAYDHLKPRPATRITTAWGAAMVDALNELHGWLTKGERDINVSKVAAKSGEFSESLTLQGKAVLKDGDPIYVADLYDAAVGKVTAAIDAARFTAALDEVRSHAASLPDIKGRLERVRLTDAGDVCVALRADAVGLAKEETLSALSSSVAKLAKLALDEAGRASVVVSSDAVGLAKEETLSAASAKLDRLDELGRLEPLAHTTEPLAAGAEWSSAVDDSPYTRFICGSVYADQPGTLYVEQSPDGVNWDVVDSFSVPGGGGLRFSVEKVVARARVRYVNGPSDQAAFRLYAYRRLRL